MIELDPQAIQSDSLVILHHEGDLLTQDATAPNGRFLPAQEVILRHRPDGTDLPTRWIRAGRMHHLGIGIEHARKRVLAFADDHHVTVADLTTGEVLSVHLIQPNRSYWRNQNKEPGRWPSSKP